MANSPAFDAVCAELEAATSFNALEARGTVRLALKAAGLDVASVTSPQLEVVLAQVLPRELESRGVENAAGVCSDISARLTNLVPDAGVDEDSPEAVFARLGSRS
ncbi:MAG: hypothetical protein MJE66_12695 [Proteobacteria bacterium]|nr:hypothetical protein [Pseudomonadota bacterium]